MAKGSGRRHSQTTHEAKIALKRGKAIKSRYNNNNYYYYYYYYY